QHIYGLSDARSGETTRLRGDQLIQLSEAGGFYRFGDLVGHFGAGGTGAGRVFGGESRGIAGLADEGERVGEIGVGFAREADDEIARERHVWPRGFDAVDDAEVIRPRVAAVHRLEDAIGARLHRQVQVWHELGVVAVGGDQLVRHVGRVAGGVAD